MKAIRREIMRTEPCEYCQRSASRIVKQSEDIMALGNEVTRLRQELKEKSGGPMSQENIRLRVKIASLEEKVERQTGIIDDLKTKVVELQAKLPPPPEPRVIHLYSEPTESGPAKAGSTHYKSFIGKNGMRYDDASPGQENAIRAMEGE